MANRTPYAVVLLVVVSLALSLSAAANAQGVPSILECARAGSGGEDAFLLKLAPCASGTNSECCSSAQSLLAIGGNGGGGLNGCMCQSLALSSTLDRVEANELAKSFGVTRDSVMKIFKDCGIQYAGGEGKSACPMGKMFGGKHMGGDMMATMHEDKHTGAMLGGRRLA